MWLVFRSVDGVYVVIVLIWTDKLERDVRIRWTDHRLTGNHKREKKDQKVQVKSIFQKAQ